MSDPRPVLCWLTLQRALEVGMPPPTWLSASEQARLATLSSPARRQSFLAGRWLARLAVRRWRGDNQLPDLLVAPSGACHVSDRRDVFVSISHHGEHLACAVAAVPVGVDVEGPRASRDYLALAETVHSPAQRDRLARLPAPERGTDFLKAWTMKEAWLKARERGLDFALMRGLEFDDPVADAGADAASPDVAVALWGELVVAMAANPALPCVIEMDPPLAWTRLRSRQLPAA